MLLEHMLLLPRDGPCVRLSVRHKSARPHFLHGRNYHAVRIVCVIKLQVTTEMFFIGKARYDAINGGVYQHNLNISNETVNDKNFESAYLFCLY